MLRAQPSIVLLPDGYSRPPEESDIEKLRRRLEKALETISFDHQEVLTASWPPPSDT
jgi:predicted metallo-beta-lactamase superfamily hydrolase